MLASEEDSVSVIALKEKVFTMVAHFVCALFTGYMLYTAKPGTSTYAEKYGSNVGDNKGLYMYVYIFIETTVRLTALYG